MESNNKAKSFLGYQRVTGSSSNHIADYTHHLTVGKVSTALSLFRHPEEDNQIAKRKKNGSPDLADWRHWPS